MIKMRNSQSGFTILELMISTVIFSVLLLGAASLLVQIGRMYYKGVVSSRTQDTTRTIADDISRTLQFGGEKIVKDSPSYIDVTTPRGTVRIHAFCIGKVRYSYIIDGQVSGEVTTYEPGDRRQNFVPHALWRDESEAPVDCAPRNILTDTDDSNGREMLGEGMRLFQFSAPTDNELTGLASFRIGVVYGRDSDLIEFTNTSGVINARCRGASLGGQWCATSLLETTVFRRIQ